MVQLVTPSTERLSDSHWLSTETIRGWSIG